MSKHSSWFRRTLLVLAGVALAACADGSGPADRILQPQAPLAARAAHQSLTKVAGETGGFTVSGMINRQGGTLSYGGYSLVVPRNSVQHPTVFTLHALSSGYLEVELTATSTGSWTSNDIGMRGFAVPVQLSIPVGDAVDPASVVVAWVRPDGELEAMPSTTADGVVTGRLTHFSQYTAATD